MKPIKDLSLSPFCLRRRIGPRPAFKGADATVKAARSGPFLPSPTGGPNFLVAFELCGQIRFSRMSHFLSVVNVPTPIDRQLTFVSSSKPGMAACLRALLIQADHDTNVSRVPTEKNLDEA